MFTTACFTASSSSSNAASRGSRGTCTNTKGARAACVCASDLVSTLVGENRHRVKGTRQQHAAPWHLWSTAGNYCRFETVAPRPQLSFDPVKHTTSRGAAAHTLPPPCQSRRCRFHLQQCLQGTLCLPRRGWGMTSALPAHAHSSLVSAVCHHARITTQSVKRATHTHLYKREPIPVLVQPRDHLALASCLLAPTQSGPP